MGDKFDQYFTVCTDALHAEEAAMDRLTDRADKYLATIGVLLGFHIVEPKPLTFSGDAAHIAFSAAAAAGLVLLIAALGLMLWSMRLRTYPTFSKTVDLRELVKATSDESAKYSAAEFYLKLRDEILAINEKRASILKVAGMVLVAGFLLAAVGQLGLGLKLY